jgi:hypothetical protein
MATKGFVERMAILPLDETLKRLSLPDLAFGFGARFIDDLGDFQLPFFVVFAA